MEHKKTIYVKLTKEQLQNMIETYKDSDPINQSHSFMIYLAMSELQRLREYRDKCCDVCKHNNDNIKCFDCKPNMDLFEPIK